MVKSVARNVMWVGRATTFMVGLAVVLALSVGLASSALAGTGVGATFNLGKTNTVSAISRLVGSVAGPSLLIDNNSTGTRATALNLQVEAGKAPMKVNSGTKVANLNADTLDGQDSSALMPSSTYRVEGPPTDNSGGENTTTSAQCDVGDKILSSGYTGLHPSDGILINLEPSLVFFSPEGYIQGVRLIWKNSAPSLDSNVQALAICADFPPAHTAP